MKSFKFPTTYEELQEKTVRFSVFDFDKFSRHDAIGEVLVRINDVDVSRELDCVERTQVTTVGKIT